MFGNVTALEGLHATGKYRDKSMTHTCSRHPAWDPHSSPAWAPLKPLDCEEMCSGSEAGSYFRRIQGLVVKKVINTARVPP